MLRSALLIAPFVAACAGHARTVPFDAPGASHEATVEWLAIPGPIVHEAVVSARWAVPTSGVIDLDDPRAATLEDTDRPIILPVHVLGHPDAGTFVVDTGVPRSESPARGLLGMFTKNIAPVEPLGDIVDRHGGALSGVLLTHTHLDHVLGLTDVPASVSVHAGPGDEAPANLSAKLSQRTLLRALGDRPLTTWDFDTAVLGVPAVDVLGDGSLYALAAPGHTPGSTAYLARTTDGPVLFTGDCSHTRWGWDHGVTPGTYTVDHDANADSLGALKALADAVPGLVVEVGHEEGPTFANAVSP